MAGAMTDEQQMSAAMSQSLKESQSFTVQDDHQEGELMSLQSTLEQVAMKNNRFDEVLKEDGEYADIRDEFEAQGIHVKQIFKVRNPRALKKFELEFLTMQDELTKGVELDMRYLYHGSRAPLLQVCSDGLDMKLGKAGHFGLGIYFSDNPLKCVLFIKDRGQRSMDPYVLRCRVICGHMKVYPPGQMDMNLVRGPLKEIKDGDYIYYDSVMGTPNTDGYREIVVYERRQVLIEHVILYDSNLKTPKAARQNSGSSGVASLPVSSSMDDTRQFLEQKYAEAQGITASPSTSRTPLDSLGMQSIRPELKNWQRQNPAPPRSTSPDQAHGLAASGGTASDSASSQSRADEGESSVSSHQVSPEGYKKQKKTRDPNKFSSEPQSPADNKFRNWTRLSGGGVASSSAEPQSPPHNQDISEEDGAHFEEEGGEEEEEEEKENYSTPPTVVISDEEDTEENIEFYNDFVRIQQSLPPQEAQQTEPAATSSSAVDDAVMLTRKPHFLKDKSPAKHRSDWMDLIDKVANGDANVKQQLVHSFDLTYNSLDEYNATAAAYAASEANAPSGNRTASDDDEDSLEEQVVNKVTQEFMDITQLTDNVKARQLVVTANCDLQAAILLYYDQPDTT